VLALEAKLKISRNLQICWAQKIKILQQRVGGLVCAERSYVANHHDICIALKWRLQYSCKFAAPIVDELSNFFLNGSFSLFATAIIINLPLLLA
jgi:hypothetical protein